MTIGDAIGEILQRLEHAHAVAADDPAAGTRSSERATLSALVDGLPLDVEDLDLSARAAGIFLSNRSEAAAAAGMFVTTAELVGLGVVLGAAAAALQEAER